MRDLKFNIQFLLKHNDFADSSPSRLSQSSERSSRFRDSDKTIIVETLLKFGANPDSLNAEGLTALHLAIRGGHADVAKKLLQRGASGNICDPKVINQVKSKILDDF